jgi:hypothetical protein
MKKYVLALVILMLAMPDVVVAAEGFQEFAVAKATMKADRSLCVQPPTVSSIFCIDPLWDAKAFTIMVDPKMVPKQSEARMKVVSSNYAKSTGTVNVYAASHMIIIVNNDEDSQDWMLRIMMAESGFSTVVFQKP